MRSIERPMSSLAAECDRSGALADDPHDRFQGRRLSRSVPPEEGHDLALPHIEIDPVKNMRFVVPGLQALDAEHSLPARRRGRSAGRLSHAPPEIGLFHLLVLGHLAIVALRQHAPTGQYSDAIREVSHDLEIVLDHQDGAVLGHAADEIGGAIDVLVAHARHRLVKQQHLRLDASVVASSSARLRP